MGLYRRKDSSVWWMSFSFQGKQYQKSTGTEDKKIAQRIYDVIKGKTASGKWIPEEMLIEKKYTFSQLAQKYSEWCLGRQRSFRKWKSYVIKHLSDRFNDMELNEFDTYTVETMQSEILKKNRTAATANRCRAVLMHMFAKAVEWDMVSEEVLKKIRRAKPLKGEKRRLRFLSLQEVERLINSCDEHLKPIVITALNTGMRKGEILSLKWANVDLNHGFILLDMTKNGERREIPINETMRNVLYSLDRRLDVPYVFYDKATGKPYQDVKRSFAGASRRAKITDFRFHDLRHTFASHLVMSGVDITTVKELLGHKTLTMTLRYAHLAPTHKIEAVKKLDGLSVEKNKFLEAKTK